MRFLTTLALALALLLTLHSVLAQVPVTSDAGAGAPVASTPATQSTQSSTAQFTPGASTPLATTSPSLSNADTGAQASIESHSSQGASSLSPGVTTTGASIEGISTGLPGGYNTPSQTATTAEPAAGTMGGNSGALQPQNGGDRVRVHGVMGAVAAAAVVVGAAIVV